jgi:hypothetical protein
VTVRDITTLQILMTYIGASTAPRPSPSLYFTFAPTPTRQWPSSYLRYVYVPSAQVVRIRYPPAGASWASVGDAAPVLDRLTEGMRAYATPRTWRTVAVTSRAASRISRVGD